MKTQLKSTQTSALQSLGFMMTLMLVSLISINVQSQSAKVTSAEVSQEGRTIRGVITNNDGPLESASIVLKGSGTGTTTNNKGEFTFPSLLKTGDVLLITYLGYVTQDVKIKDTSSFLNIQLTEDLIEFSGALNSDTPYKSKRSKD